MKHAIINNIPKNPKDILDDALKISFNSWVDEKGTKDNPDVWRRNPSKLSYEEAFKIIQKNKPHWVISYRDMTIYNEDSYWEFGGCNISSNDYGEVFIWIQVKIDDALDIFKKYNLKIKEY